MKLLLHTCCGPCLLYPLLVLEEQGYEVTGYFYNPNIHPYREFRKRYDSLLELSENSSISLVVERNYGFETFIKAVVFKENMRCSLCYDMRLTETVQYAKRHGFSSFSTTLLYSRYQNHVLIREKCALLSDTYDIPFIYHDFREGWQQGIDLSIEKGLYRQPYCGCIYSEQERFDNRLKKKLRKK
jgi:hypothetical protein